MTEPTHACGKHLLHCKDVFRKMNERFETSVCAGLCEGKMGANDTTIPCIIFNFIKCIEHIDDSQ